MHRQVGCSESPRWHWCTTVRKRKEDDPSERSVVERRRCDRMRADIGRLRKKNERDEVVVGYETSCHSI